MVTTSRHSRCAPPVALGPRARRAAAASPRAAGRSLRCPRPWAYGIRMQTSSSARADLRVVTNQAAAARRPQRGRRRRRAERGRAAPRHRRRCSTACVALGAEAGVGRGPRARPARQRAPPRAGALRPLRPPGRRGGLPPLLALADGARRRPRPGRHARGGAGRGRAARPPAPRRRLHGLVAHRARARLPGLDDVRRGAGAAGRRGDREGVDPAAGLAPLRPRRAHREREARGAARAWG